MIHKPRGKAQSYSLDKVLVQWEILKHFHRRLVEISGVEENQQIDEFLDSLQILLNSTQSSPVAGRLIYVVQTEVQRENNCVKVGFCSNTKSRWGSQWGRFTNKAVFNSPFKGDAEIHSHLRKHFERDENQGREVYFGEFEQICQVVSNFLS